MLSCAREVGVVGEVDIGWAQARAPTVLVDWDPATPAEAGGAWGPLQARQTRPWESLELAGASIPLAVNSYTGGAADWPARFARAATDSRAGGVAMHLALGALLLSLAHRFLCFHGTPTAAGGVAILLATDWVFVFFKRVLGGTEILLQAAGLLVIWALFSRRWKGGQHGTVALALGAGLGLGAKVTFAATLAAFAVAALLTRWDRPNVLPPARVSWPLLGAVVLVCVSPVLLANLHHGVAVLEPAVVSHDTLALQWARLGGGGMGRESLTNLGRFLGNPLAWLGSAWGTVALSGASPLRLLTLAVAVGGSLVEWRDRTRSPSAALLRFLSLAVPLQLAALFALNQDLHHLAQASVPLALWTALGADRVAAMVARPRSAGRALATAAFLFPAMLAGGAQLRNTDAVVRTARARTFTANGQLALTELIREAGVRRLVVTDYELYGAIEQLVPEVEVIHGWGAVSRGDKDLAGLRAVAAGGHYLRVEAAAPFIYNWRADDVGLRVGALSDGKRNWAELYRVE